MAEMLERAKSLAGRLSELRRTIHRRPGLGFAVEETAALVAAELRQLGIAVTEGVAGTGVKGVLTGDAPGPAVLLRADMDGLPVVEATGLPFASEIPGRMHACGHDVHTACLLGAARLLAEQRHRLIGTVVFAFQPAEEGPGGALPMIEAGLLQEPRVEAAFMLHCDPGLRAGTVGVHHGAVCANCDDFTLEIVGQGGHGSAPHRGVDAIVAAGAFIMAVQSVVSRRVDPLAPAVVSLGTVEGGYRSNVIADRVRFTGTLRSLSDGVRERLRQDLEQVARGVAEAYGTTYRLELEPGYPGYAAGEGAAARLEQAAAALLGKGQVVRLDRPSLGAEDFAYIAQRVPAASLQLGVSTPEQGFGGELHSPGFNPDEACLPVGAAVLAQTALDLLGG